jgi:U3 small nucleolar RNA-associated protein 14
MLQAEHLSFPLQEEPTGRISNLELAAKFKVLISSTTVSFPALKAAQHIANNGS